MSTRYNCDVQVFPFNIVKRTGEGTGGGAVLKIQTGPLAPNTSYHGDRDWDEG